MSNIDITKHKCECGSVWFEVITKEDGMEIICVACGKKQELDD